MIGSKRDCSAALSAALACWGAGDREGAKRFWAQAPDALANHQGRGDAASWLRPACYVESLFEDMLASGVDGIDSILTDTFHLDLLWLEWPGALSLIAKKRPDFLRDIVSFGVPLSDFGGLADEDDENVAIALDYFPPSLGMLIQREAQRHISRDGDGWAQLMANAAAALAQAGPENLPSDISEAIGFLREQEASEEAIASFRESVSEAKKPRSRPPL